MKKALILFLSVMLLALALVFTASAAQPSFTPKVSVTLAEDIVFNVYLPMGEKIDRVVLDGEELDLDSLPQKDGYYHARVPLTAKNALKTVNMSVTLDVGGSKVNGSFTYSIPKYVSTVLGGNSSEATKTLAKDLLNYLDSATVFFGGSPSAEVASILGSYEGAFSINSAASTTPALEGAAFVLGDYPSIRFYPESAYLSSDFSFSNKHGALTYTRGTDSEGDYLEIKLYAYSLKDTVSYTVGSLSGEYNLSAYYSYVKDEYSKPDRDKLLKLTENLYIYSVSANRYRSESTGITCSHTYTSKVKTEATPTTEGTMLYTCNKCDDTYKQRIPTTLKLLAIGNSFSEDSFKHMYIVAKNAGIENVVLGNMYIGGCTLATHKKNMQENLGKYKFWISSDTAGGMVVEGDNRTALYGITYTDWDYVSIQQASNLSGKADTYSDIPDIVNYINANKTGDAEILWHMTWAYQQDSTHSGFSNYNKNQMTMYNAIVNAVKTDVLTNSNISGVIPSGTAVQNLRTSALGDTLTRDGYHLSHGIGRYTAALTWIAYITGCDVDKITATPTDYPEVAQSLDYIKDAVKKAIAKPYEVTQSAYPPTSAPDPEPTPTPDTDLPFDAKVLNLTADDISYLESKGLDASDYMLLDLEVTYNAYYQSTHASQYAKCIVAASDNSQYMKWWATRIFSKSELVSGSIIRLDSGYKYRPEAWTNMAKNPSSARPDVVEEDYIVIDDEWWGDFNYRGFNIGKSSGAAYTQSEYDAYAEKPDTHDFKIYIPVVKRADLTAEDISFLTSKGLNANDYKVLDFEHYYDYYYNSISSNSDFASLIVGKGNQDLRFIATEIFTKHDLTEGSLIRILDDGVRYRPDGWIDLSTRNTSRPGNIDTKLVTVSSDWWGTYNYRGFNISLSSGGVIDESNASSLRFYIKIS